MSSTQSGTVDTTPYAFLLFLVFLVLKLTHVINWSWWWVTAPLWGSLAFIIVVGIAVLTFAVIVGGATKFHLTWRGKRVK